MKGKRFSVEQIVAVLKQVELGLPVADAIRHVGIWEIVFKNHLPRSGPWTIFKVKLPDDAAAKSP